VYGNTGFFVYILNFLTPRDSVALFGVLFISIIDFRVKKLQDAKRRVTSHGILQ